MPERKVIMRGVAIACSFLGFLSGCSGLDDSLVTDTVEGNDATFAACLEDSQCDDGNLCTSDACTEGGCAHQPAPNIPCEDGNLCTENDRCNDEGGCSSGAEVEVSSPPCAECSCSPLEGIICVARDEGSPCDDGDCCVEDSSCMACAPEDEGCNVVNRQCVGTAHDCADGDPCTVNVCACDEGVQSCSADPSPDGTVCSYSENDCTVGDHCVEGQCVTGPPMDLDDDNPCTKDLCIKGVAEHEPLLEGQCDDGDNCTTEDYCFLGTCVGGEQVACVVTECASSASCVTGEGCVSVWKPAGAVCNDGNPCTVDEFCDGESSCVSEGEQACDDLNPCTDDSCDPDQGCIHHPNDLGCEDGDVCTIDDQCIGGVCVGESDLVVDVGFDCTQVNGLDQDGCGDKADPTGEYEGAHIVDLGTVQEGKGLNCCVAPGAPNGCAGLAYIHTSVDGQSWTESKAVFSGSVDNGDGTWAPTCVDAAPEGPFRFIRGAHAACPVNFFSCSLQCAEAPEVCGAAEAVCDDGNSCTVDACDEVSGECTHTPQESATCMKLKQGNNLVSFSILPENPTLKNVLGDVEPLTVYLIGEGRVAFRLSNGEWAGNLTRIERTAGYWIALNLPTGQKYAMLELQGTPTDPDVKYTLHKGVNSVSYAGVNTTPVPVVLPDAVESLFTILIGEGLATIPKDGGWIGSLTSLVVNHGYEVIVTEPISEFQYECVDCDGVDPYTYGCTWESASNYDPAAEIDDGSCTYSVPTDWVFPQWSDKKYQSFVVFHNLHVGGAPADIKDAVGVFSGGENIGFGHPTGAFTVAPAMNLTMDAPLTYKVYDASAGGLTEIVIDPPITWNIGGWVVAGCTDPSAANYSPFATYSANNCTP